MWMGALSVVGPTTAWAIAPDSAVVAVTSEGGNMAAARWGLRAVMLREHARRPTRICIGIVETAGWLAKASVNAGRLGHAEIVLTKVGL